MSSAAVHHEWRLAEEDRRATNQLAAALGVPPIVAHLLRLRHVTQAREGEQFLNPAAEHLEDPFLLRDMERAVARLKIARERQERILVFGDYDVDGIAGTAILMNALRRFGLSSCQYAVPSRITEGFGLSPEWVDKARKQDVTLIVTVDNGTNAREAAERAKTLGIDLIITDHHNLEGNPPEALAVVNPKRENTPERASQISGAAVALKLGWALTGDIVDVDLAALGTVADIVPLRGENRVIVALGLAEMAKQSRPGLVALARVAGTTVEKITAETIAFHLAPRINAGGRLGDGLTGLKLFLAEDANKATPLALELDQANQERRKIERLTLDQAQKALATQFRPEQRTIILAQRGWHPGVIGIVASRLQKNYYRPIALIAVDENGLGRGSVRGIERFDVMAALSAAAEHLVRFGGHRAAGGMTIHESQIEAFRAAFESAAAQQLPPGESTSTHSSRSAKLMPGS